MSTKSNRLAGQYLAALRTHLGKGPQASLAPAGRLGRRAMRMGLGTLDLAQMHELALIALAPPMHPPGNGNGAIQWAGSFFRQALTPLAAAQVALRQPSLQVQPANGKPRLFAARLAAAKQRLRRETVRRRTAEADLKKGQRHYGQLLAQSRLMQEQLRHLAHQILLVQEEERKHISRELHDEISQILTGINVRLAALKIVATANTGDLSKRIASTQRLVEKSVATVHRFARELRPAMLDDLGLVPALVTHMKEFGRRTGLRIRFTSVGTDQLEKVGSLGRTVLYRVAQEALTNVDKHAQASLVKVTIQAQSGTIYMEVVDDGKSFDVEQALQARRRTRLGLLGMRERVEMVGGTFVIDSAPGQGTAVRVRIPFCNGTRE